MAQKPTIPSGTRDFSPAEMLRRNYIFNSIKEIFQLYGFQPIETPAMENLSTLLGKYGEEGDKLLFKILNSGEFAAKTSTETFAEKNHNKLALQFCERGLRYDLTVPFARFIVMHQSDIVFPFKRYQIQPVWRADRPQKGRYREFYQCDVDVIGSDSLLNEVELIQIVSDVYRKLNINVLLKLNNRKILSGIAEVIGAPEKIVDITVAIDKLDKIGIEKVNEELQEKGISKESVEFLQPIINLSGSNTEKLNKLSEILKNSETGKKGIDELQQVLKKVEILTLPLEIEIDLCLARGLNYYTGCIFEVKAKDVLIGSITGGGRYDDLTGVFGLKNVSGVGISFGADRIYDVMLQLNLFPENALSVSKILFINFGEKETEYCLPILARLRKAGISAEIYPDAAKMKKQMEYANRRNFAFVVMAGEEEMNAGKLKIKNMTTGEQNMMSVEDFLKMMTV